MPSLVGSEMCIRDRIVSMFLAILELVKSNELYLYQEDLRADIQLIRREESE